METRGQLPLSAGINGKDAGCELGKECLVSTETTQTSGKTGSKENQGELTVYSWQEKMSQPRAERCKLSGFKRLSLKDVKSLIWDKKRFSLKHAAPHGSVRDREC